MFLLIISVGRDWSVHSILKFSAIKKNLRIISDIMRESFLDSPISYGFSRVLVFNSE